VGAYHRVERLLQQIGIFDDPSVKAGCLHTPGYNKEKK